MAALKPAVNAADHHKGNINAAITLVEYGDFQCPHCGLAHPLVERLLNESGKDLHFVFRNFPLGEIHRHAYAAAVAAEAAGKQGKFWEMYDLIFANQNKLNPFFLLELGEEIDLDLEQFANDLKSEEIQNKVEKDFESGVRSGVNGTPTFFINGSRMLTYDETYESLLDAIHRESDS
jgi:protein-disulfide isomerase